MLKNWGPEKNQVLRQWRMSHMDTMWATMGSQKDRPHPKPFFDFEIHRIANLQMQKKEEKNDIGGAAGSGYLGGGR